MYICICNAIRETELRAMARKSRGTAEELYARLGHVPNCAQCLEEADEIVREARCARKLPVPRLPDPLTALAMEPANAA